MNRIESNKYHREYYHTHKEVINKRRLIYQKNRRKEDPKYKLLCNLRSGMSRVLKNNQKSKDTESLIGCHIKELKVYLEKQFKPGMSWGNYGNWHIDHIKPCASFDLSKTTEQKKCFNYKNLQPLWAEENFIKSNKSI